MPPGAPPLIVNVHGGPTSQRSAGYYSEAQFFTTRGYAVLLVNHRGSTGYGKAYMNMHRGNWGVYDVIDSMAGVKHLASQGLADESKAVIMGGSAGGFTVLQSLVDFPGFYRAGVCSYGVSNQFGLLMDTHKFEERYTFWLLGELPEAADALSPTLAGFPCRQNRRSDHRFSGHRRRRRAARSIGWDRRLVEAPRHPARVSSL